MKVRKLDVAEGSRPGSKLVTGCPCSRSGGRSAARVQRALR